EDGIRDDLVTGVQTCALPISPRLTAPVKPSEFPSVRFFRNEVNEGFTGAVNRGVREGKVFQPDFYFLLNNDAQLKPGALEALVRSEERRVGKEVRVWWGR